MAPRSSAKRAQSPKGNDTKKPRVNDQMRKIVEVLETSDLPAPCRDMLVAMVPRCLDVAPHERHEYQDLALEFISEVFENVRAKRRQQIHAAEELLAGAGETEQTLKDLLQKADTFLNAKTLRFQALKQVLAKLFTEVSAAKVSLSEVQGAKKINQDALDAWRKEQEEMVAAQQTAYPAIKNGTWQTAQARQHIHALLAMSKKASLDSSLATVIPSSCVKRPSDRSKFDNMVIEQIGECLVRRLVELSTQIETASLQAAQDALLFEQAQSTLNRVQEKHQRVEEDIANAQEEQQTAKEHLVGAQNHLRNWEVEHQKAMQTIDDQKRALALFEEDPMACFKLLRDGSPVLPPATQNDKVIELGTTCFPVVVAVGGQ